MIDYIIMNHLLLITACIPSISMALSANYLNLIPTHQTLLESFTAGLLIVSGALLLSDIQKTTKTKFMGIMGFIISLSLIKYVDDLTMGSGMLPSLYFDSLSDGILLGSLASTFKKMKQVITHILPITIEMVITASSAVSILNSQKQSKSKFKVTIGAAILGIAILIGNYISRFIDDAFIIGFGSASMLWLGLKEFIPKIMKGIKTQKEATHNNIVLFLGIIASVFLE